MIITIDGPAGGGKGTLGRSLAEKLSYTYIDTGILFRLVAWQCLKSGCNLNDENEIASVIKKIDFENNGYSSELRAEAVGEVASQIGAMGKVRQAFKARMQNFSKIHKKGIIVDGRDMGTEVFPNAEFKIYLTASPEVRALRRLHDLQERGIPGEIDVILNAIKNRDYQDQTRPIAPMKPAVDALIVDSSDMTAQEVLEKVLSFLKKGHKP